MHDSEQEDIMTYDAETIKEAYVKAFEYLSINGIQSREDLAETLRNAFNTTKIQLAELITELKDRNDKLEAKLTELGVDVNTIKETTTNLTDRISYIEKKTKIHKPYSLNQAKPLNSLFPSFLLSLYFLSIQHKNRT